MAEESAKRYRAAAQAQPSPYSAPPVKPAETKPAVSLLPWNGLLACANIMAKNQAAKDAQHADGKWRTQTFAHHLGCAARHLAQYLAGYADEDHLAHAACRLLMALDHRMTGKP
jgi:hypothetical protein